ARRRHPAEGRDRGRARRGPAPDGDESRAAQGPSQGARARLALRVPRDRRAQPRLRRLRNDPGAPALRHDQTVSDRRLASPVGYVSQTAMFKRHHQLFTALRVLLDLCFVAAAFGGAYALRFGSPKTWPYPELPQTRETVI